MAISVSAINRRSYIHVVIMLSLMLGVGFLPPFAQVTPLGMKVLGVFLGLVYGWCFIDLLWTSVLGFFALGLTGFMDTTTAVATAFGNPICNYYFDLFCLCGMCRPNRGNHSNCVLGIRQKTICWQALDFYLGCYYSVIDIINIWSMVCSDVFNVGCSG